MLTYLPPYVLGSRENKYQSGATVTDMLVRALEGRIVAVCAMCVTTGLQGPHPGLKKKKDNSGSLPFT